jgi:predicted RNase H-like HicB family nuclease
LCDPPLRELESLWNPDVSRLDSIPVRRHAPDMKFQIVLEPGDEGGFTAIVPSLPGCISEGRNRDEALKNIQQAIELYLEPVDDDSNFSDRAEMVEISV